MGILILEGKQVKSTSFSFDGFRGLLCSEKEAASVSSLYDAEWYLLVSLKNPGFSKDYIHEFCELVGRFRSKGFIGLVDTPYLQNISAIEDESLKSREIQKYMKIRREKERLVSKFSKFSKISLVDWEEIFNSTPSWVMKELSSAFYKRGRVHRYLIEQTRGVFDSLRDERKLERLARFLLEEYPTLLYIYYLTSDRPVVDVYPGKNAEFFWALERDEFHDEMPDMSRIVREGAGILYVQIE